MDKQLAKYIRQHIVFVISVVVIGFVLLAVGEYYLNRQIMHVNKMVSEGFMQIKSVQEVDENENADVMLDEVIIEDKIMMEE